MKLNKIIKLSAGVLLFATIFLISVWLVSPAKTLKSREISLDDAINRIKNNEITEIVDKGLVITVEDKSQNHFFVLSNPNQKARNSILKVGADTQTPIQYETTSNCWLSLLNKVAPFIILGICLAVVVSITFPLSRNKG